MKEVKNCWECRYNKLGGDTFLGRCQQKNLKHIPPHVVDKGCSKFLTKSIKEKQLSLL